MKQMTFRRPDNWHAHPRQDDLLALVCHCFDIYGRVLCVGNISPLVETADDALSYKHEILRQNVLFDPVTCTMITDTTTPETIYDDAQKGIKFVKFIPVGTSTGAVRGLKLDDFEALDAIFTAIQDTGLHLLLHAELLSFASRSYINLLAREEMAVGIVVFYRKLYPRLKITIEHVSTADMIHYVKCQDSAYTRATLTPQHAILTYSDAFDRHNRLYNPHNYCLPVLKSDYDRQTVARAMVSGDEHFFAGTDAAPHWAAAKNGINPPPGIFFGPTEYLRYLEVFARHNALDKFEDFTSRFGAEYYGYPLNEGTLTIASEIWRPPVNEKGIRYCMGGESVRWKIIGRDGIDILCI